MPKPTPRDVGYLQVQLRPITYCEPPQGQSCAWTTARADREISAIRRHCLDHPGHTVFRDQVTRAEYRYDG